MDKILEQLSFDTKCSPLETSAVAARFERPSQDSIIESLNERANENEGASAANRQNVRFAYSSTSKVPPETANSNQACTARDFSEGAACVPGNKSSFGGSGPIPRNGAPDVGSNPICNVARKNYTWKSVDLLYQHVKDYAPGHPIRNEKEFFDAIQNLKRTLLIDPKDWRLYVQKFGQLEASLVIAYMTRDGMNINNFGAYFYTMFRRAEQGKLYPLRLLARKN